MSLRTTLVAVTVLCVVLALKVEQAKQQRMAVAWIKDVQGLARYDYEVDSEGQWHPNAEMPGPEWLRELLGINYLDCFDRLSNLRWVFLDRSRSKLH